MEGENNNYVWNDEETKVFVDTQMEKSILS